LFSYFFPFAGEVIRINKQKFGNQEKFDREVFAAVQRRIKKVTPLLLLDVTEAWRPFWVSEFELDKKLKFDHGCRGKPQTKENIYDQSYSHHQRHLFRRKFT